MVTSTAASNDSGSLQLAQDRQDQRQDPSLYLQNSGKNALSS